MHKSLYNIFKKQKYSSIKHRNYFPVYENLFNKFINKRITFVEVGILNGGSLFMWRNYFGNKARIIGIDFNPSAKKWENYGFEIFIGDQNSSIFWKKTLKKIKKIDVLLDDGAHTNRAQIMTTVSCLPYISEGGLLLVEDVHTSYQKEFGNPSKYSFINYSKFLIDDINSRFENFLPKKYSFNKFVHSIQFFESMVCFNINRKLCKRNSVVENSGIKLGNLDYRYNYKNDNIFLIRDYLNRNFYFLKKLKILKNILSKINILFYYFYNKKNNVKIYFK
jgi:hypothetical protein